jgi:hypothetical protein
VASATQIDRPGPRARREVAALAEELDLEPEELVPYGRDKAKIELSALERLSGQPDGRLIAVTAVTPTKGGEGKTTTAISLADGLGHIGERSLVCLREPSVGPTLGAKGGGTGGGLAQVVPREDINLHFTATCTRSRPRTTFSHRPSTHTWFTATISRSTRPRFRGGAASTSRIGSCGGSTSGSAKAIRSHAKPASTSRRPRRSWPCSPWPSRPRQRADPPGSRCSARRL